MIGIENAPFTYEYNNYYKILPEIHSWHSDPVRIGDGKKVDPNFVYSSDKNNEWMTNETLKDFIDKNHFID